MLPTLRLRNRHDILVVAGGDGTVNEAVNGLRDARLPLAVVPLGTANVLAAEIGMATDPRSVARTIALGRPRPVSVGELRQMSHVPGRVASVISTR